MIGTRTGRSATCAWESLCSRRSSCTTSSLCYQFSLASAAAVGTADKNGVLVHYHTTFVYYVNVAVVGYILGAMASFLTGLADGYGRVNIVTYGLLIVGLPCLFGVLNTHSKLSFAIVFIPLVFLLTGPRSPRRAKREVEVHEASGGA